MRDCNVNEKSSIYCSFSPVFSPYFPLKGQFGRTCSIYEPSHFLRLLICFFAACFLITAKPAAAASLTQDDVLRKWYGLSLLLIRHTPTYSPPVASRTLAYMGVVSYEAVASGSSKLYSLDGQLNGLSNLPKRDDAQSYDEVALMQATLSTTIATLFANTGPSGQQAIKKRSEEHTSELQSH